MRAGYLGHDYPQTWGLPPLDAVHMPLENTVHYTPDTPAGIAEWSTTLPSGGGLLHLGPAKRPFSISMFHQLRCLGILRGTLVRELQRKHLPAPVDSDLDPLVRHCMGYIRQMVLCRSELRLESVRSPFTNRATISDVTHTCRDWSAVYDAAEENYQMWAGNRTAMRVSGSSWSVRS